MKITLNPAKDEPLEINSWTVLDEPSRVAVDIKGYSYEFVNRPEGLLVEIWKLDEDGEPAMLVDAICLPTYGNSNERQA